MKRSEQDIAQVLAALWSAKYVCGRDCDDAPARERPKPFVTISRQADAGGRSFARLLAKRLNAADPGELPWTVWDNELVERVAVEHQLPAASIESLEDQQPSWLEEALGGLMLGDHPDELNVYHRVAATTRLLAEMGRVVIVGRGGAFITRNLLGGIHLRLVAPLEFRVAATNNPVGRPNWH